MINKLHFGKRIAVFRRKQNLSQAELAEKLGVSAQAVSKWETAMAFPDIELLLELSKLYGVSINELLEGIGSFPPWNRTRASPQRPFTQSATAWTSIIGRPRFLRKTAASENCGSRMNC